MAGLGAVATETELKSITVYLSRHFFPVVNINTASAREVSDALELPIREAETITQYREQHGTFKSWDDLAKVPDLDLKKIEQRKDRVVF
jgi:competence ComEA-like helix-hairpin-helix protein